MVEGEVSERGVSYEPHLSLQPDDPMYLGPSLREKTLLLTRMMVFYEKRFPDELELVIQFLDIVLYIYK